MADSKKFDIGIDTRMLHHTGIGRYLKGLLSPLLEYSLSRSWKFGLFGVYDGALPFRNEHKKFNVPIYSLREQLNYPKHVRQCRLWHSPHYNIPICKGSTKLVVTVHDLIHWLFRKESLSPLKSFYAKWMMKRVIGQADHIIAVSHKTKEDLITHFRAQPARISVVHEGVTSMFKELNDVETINKTLNKFHIPQKYFLYIGMIKSHKQVHRLVRAYRKLRQANKLSSALVVVGKIDSSYANEFEEIKLLKRSESIYHIDFINDDDLVALYNGALALIHPSKYEGFGLTLLEAMACGTPVIACRTASIPEVVGDAAYLINPDFEPDLERAMVSLEQDPLLCRDLVARGKSRVHGFRWKTTAAKTADLYEKVLR